MGGIDGLLRHTLEVVRTTNAPSADPEGTDLGHGVATVVTAGTYRGLIQPRSARERVSLAGREGSMGDFRAYLEEAAIGQVDVDDVIRKTGLPDADLNADYRINFVGNAAGQGHHLEVDLQRVTP